MLGTYCLFATLVGNASSDILDYYMMGILPSTIHTNREIRVVVPEISNYSLENMQNYYETVVNLYPIMKKIADSNIELVQIASNNFTQTIDAYDMSSNDLNNFGTKLSDRVSIMAANVLYAHYLNELNYKISSQTVKTNESPSIHPRFVLTAALLAGLLFAGEQAAEHTYFAIDEQGSIGEEYISKAEGKELKAINIELGIPENATRDQALAKFRSFNFVKRANIATNNIAKANEKEGDGTAIPKVRTGFANTSTKVAKEGLTLTVGVEVTVGTGGQGLDKLAEAAGLSAEEAALFDLAVSTAGKQPLDYVVKATESKSKTTQTIPASTTTISTTKAISILDALRKSKNDAQVSAEEAVEAIRMIMRETARLIPDTIINPDGSVEVPIPDKMDLKLFDKVEDGDIVKMRDIDKFDFLLMAAGKQPLKYSNLDASSLKPSDGNVKALDIDLLDPLPQCPISVNTYSIYYPQGVEDKEDGSYTECYYESYSGEMGINYERHYENNTLVMDLAYYSPNSTDSIGLLYTTTYFKSDVKNYQIAYYQSGNLWGTGSYDELGKKTGKEYTFYDDAEGRLAIMTEYTSGKKNGKQIYYYYEPPSQWCYLWSNDTFIGYCPKE